MLLRRYAAACTLTALAIQTGDAFVYRRPVGRGCLPAVDAPATPASPALSYLPSRTALGERLLLQEHYEEIQNGRIAVVPDFLSATEVQQLRGDAQTVVSHFTTDALASYGTSGKFDPTKDRTVLKLNQWKDASLGDYELRRRFGNRLAALREELSVQLQRPYLNRGVATTAYGHGSTEISYTRFGPGAFLARHVDEHHEELKGKDGWSRPTRRSLSWLVYLNEDWKTSDGGQLRCFQRPNRPATRIGARPNGDLQIAWLKPTLSDPVERPVYMSTQRPGHRCAMYVMLDDDTVPTAESPLQTPTYISRDFDPHPILYVAGSEALAKQLLVGSSGASRELSSRFHLIEPPKSRSKMLDGLLQKPDPDEMIADIEPTAGTLVVFDSVTLPHEVLATTRRDRWATSGWFHEDQQPVGGREPAIV